MPTIETLLHNTGTGISRFESEILIAHTIKKTRTLVIAHPEYPVSEKQSNQFASYILRRMRHEPIALIVGHKEFYGREFSVDQYTLIPRPETELLVENVLDHIAETHNGDLRRHLPREHASTFIIDIGTGSGNIIITLSEEITAREEDKKYFTFIATDISKDALDMARKNAKRLGARKNIRFIRSDLLEKIPKKKFLDANEIIIAANLPYLSEEEFRRAPLDVRNFEPKSALESGLSGLDHYQRLLEELRQLIEKQKITSQVTLFLEISPSQEASVQRCILAVFPKSTTVLFQDLAKKYRLVKISLRVSPQAQQ